MDFGWTLSPGGVAGKDCAMLSKRGFIAILNSFGRLRKFLAGVASKPPFPLMGKGRDRGAPEPIELTPLPLSFPVKGKELRALPLVPYD